MRTTIKATNMSMSPAVSDYIDKKVEAFGKFVADGDTTALCAIEVGHISQRHKSGNIFRAEFTLYIGGRNFRAEASEATLYSALDTAQDEILRELRRDKKKRLSVIRRGGARMKELARRVTSQGMRIKDVFRWRGRR
jgi:ribosomal subunit interface protein